MKKFLALAAVLVVSSVNAEELKFGDLNYFLKAGQFNVGGDVIANNETVRDSGTNVDVDSYLVNTHYAYAFTDSLNVVLGVDLLIDGETEPKVGASADAQGFQNPTLGVNFRAMDQSTSGMNLDFGAVARVKVIQREFGTDKKEGNSISPIYSKHAEPRNGLELNARLGKKWNEANEFYFLVGATHHLDGEGKQLQGNKVKFDSSTDFKASANYQYRPINEFMMNFGLAAVSYAEMKGKDGANKFEVSDHLDFVFGFDAKYLVTETTIAKFIFTKDRRDKFDVKDSLGTDKFDKRGSIQYGLGVDFLF